VWSDFAQIMLRFRELCTASAVQNARWNAWRVPCTVVNGECCKRRAQQRQTRQVTAKLLHKVVSVMPHLFSSDGLRALRDTFEPKKRLLLALDFDGTLAPIVPLPELAQTSPEIAKVLAEIARQVDIAVVSGRSVADVSGRLGFDARFVVGNHGLEGLPDRGGEQALGVVEQWREALDESRLHELASAGVMLEDKGHSLSFHYRLASDRDAALAAIDRVVDSLRPAPRRLAGKCVINVLPDNAADKFYAIRELARHTCSDMVIFAGDDVTDDVVFEQAPPHWLTIRVDSAGEARRARFHLAQTDMVLFLQRLLAEIRPQALA
jgi:trehalose 6-phosphate phosphatase